ncbi:hypothetical protein E3N88_25745 [Mikania micrantha]|uniref:Cytochrome P450 n=1 Tax=Mikania micrantha TaxID=192012 RepID=A0A5N6N708_9ASTR|nr:hypothetical protein E3N88_25745 [Mikania micrantha]
MLLNRPTFRWIHELMDRFNSSIICIRLGPSTNVIAVSSPDLACEFFKKQDEIFCSRPYHLSTFLISDGYLATALSPSGEQWRKMKRVLSREMLSSPTHKWLQPKRDEEADKLLRYIYNQIKKQDSVLDGGLINVRTVTQHFCGNTMRNMIFGTRFFGQGMDDGGPGDEEIEHVAALFAIMKHHFAFCITDYFSWLRRKTDFDGHEKKLRTAIEVVRKYQDPLVNERIQMWKMELERRNELMIATIDNPSNAVEWTIGEMITKPMILKRAIEEMDRVVGRDKLVEEQDLPQLNYLNACIKEAFRLHLFSPFLPPHVSTMDTTVAGYFIPKGSHVIVSRYRLGRNPNVWADPLRFDPDRHLLGEGKQMVMSDIQLRMLSFSTGKRGCPGMMLGTAMTTMLLARMVQGFTWEIPCNEGYVDLAESRNELCLARPLMVVAKQRLPSYMYPK